MRHASSYIFITLAVLATLMAGASGAEVRGDVSVGSGYLEHPVGITEEADALYTYQTLRLSSFFRASGSTIKLGYEGQASQFGNDTQLGSQRHGLGGEWLHASADRRLRLSAGVQGAIRRQEDWYALYDQEELFAYAAMNRYTGSNLLWKGYVGYRVRAYDDLPEESCVEPHVQLEVLRFSHTRTSLGLRLRYGYKAYTDDSAPLVWETSTTPSTSQLAARILFTKSLSERTGLRTWAEYRWKLSEFPHVITEDFYDSPVLDGYATEGFDLYAAIKTLAPHQWWVETGVAFGVHDYGEILFPTSTEEGQDREDTGTELHLSLQRTLGRGLGRPKLNILGGWRAQSSTHEWYDYSGVFFSTNLSWKF